MILYFTLGKVMIVGAMKNVAKSSFEETGDIDIFGS